MTPMWSFLYSTGLWVPNIPWELSGIEHAVVSYIVLVNQFVMEVVPSHLSSSCFYTIYLLLLSSHSFHSSIPLLSFISWFRLFTRAMSQFQSTPKTLRAKLYSFSAEVCLSFCLSEFCPTVPMLTFDMHIETKLLTNSCECCSTAVQF